MTAEAVTVDFFIRSVRRPEPENEEQFWICVKASSQSPDIHGIKIDLCQTDDGPGAIVV